MGTADRYCAICGCSIGIGSLIIGSNSKKAKGIRQRLLEAGLQQRAGELTGDNEEHGYSDEDSALNILDLEHSYAIEHAYDPKVMECRDVALSNFDRFYKHVRLVMYDPKIENLSKYFISGETEVDDFGWGTVLGGHPSRPDEQFENVMYMEYSEEDVKAFPCHGLCLQMLAKAVSGKFDSKLLNPEVLYKIMYDLNENDGQMLNIGYGDVSGQEQYWECKSGEEYAVINPLEFYDQHMRKLMSLTIDSGTMAKNANGSETHDTTVDPFHALSNELIHHITRYLSGNEVFSLRQASTIIRQSTSGNSYWKPRVEKDLQWLWIPPGLDRKTASGEIGGGNRQIDWMKVYGLFDSATAHPWGMKGKYMGLANRRRIWIVCEEPRSLYKAYAARSGESIINPDVDRRTWSESDEIDTLWRAAFERLESSERWMGCKDCRDG